MVAAILLALVVDSAIYNNKVHAGVSVAGVNLGGLTRDEAAATLARYVVDAEKTPIKLVSGDKTFDITPGDVGAKVDVTAAVSAAMDVTRGSNFVVDTVRRFKLYFSDTDLTLTGTFDPEKMDSQVVLVAKQLGVPAVPMGLAINDGAIEVVEGQEGNVVDQRALSEQLGKVLFSLGAVELEIPMMVDEPDVQAENTEKAVADARVMISARVTLTRGERSWTLTPDDIAAYMDFASETRDGESTLVAYLSASKMSPLLSEVADLAAKAPVNATFKSDGNKAWVVRGQMGRALDAEATVEALTAAALKTSGRTAKAVVVEVEPELTAKKAEAMGIKERLGGWMVEHWGVEERQQNVRITTKYADAIIPPGGIYNFDRQIGPRTEERGFMLAPGIVGEGNLEDVLGGGICQVATTLFNAVFVAGLEIVERHNHSLYFSHYPAGRDATVTAGAKNFQFRNDTDHYVWVHGSSDGITTRFNVYGTDDGRKSEFTFSGWTYGDERTVETVLDASLSPGTSVLQRAGQSARSCTVTRIVTMPDGTVLHKGPEIYGSSYEMITRIIEVSPFDTTAASPTTTPGSTTSTTGG
ncbi:MAG: hypothetical protein A2133_05945 [Actinobacteria bacterium RBG_16_64_13]|nr:MAG: hypothetical protein A2133_05945 [Actinobacteria bacterium RBG_16_64_13]